jgi:uncharacterized protein (DUF3820 family)
MYAKYKIMDEMTDASLMPFGVHKGKKLIDVPAPYLIFLHDNGTAGSVGKYIIENMDVLRFQTKSK